MCASSSQNQTAGAAAGGGAAAPIRSRARRNPRASSRGGVLEFGIGIFLEVGSNFIQQRPHFFKIRRIALTERSPAPGGGRARGTKVLICKGSPRSAWRKGERAVFQERVRTLTKVKATAKRLRFFACANISGYTFL